MTLLPSVLVLVIHSAYHIFIPFHFFGFFVCFLFLFLFVFRSIQEHAAKMFPSNVENRTIHSLAYRKVGFRLEEQYSWF